MPGKRACKNFPPATRDQPFKEPLGSGLLGASRRSQCPRAQHHRFQVQGFQSRVQSTHTPSSQGEGLSFFSVSAKGGPKRSTARENLPGSSTETSFPSRCFKTERKGKNQGLPWLSAQSGSIREVQSQAAPCAGQERAPSLLTRIRH